MPQLPPDARRPLLPAPALIPHRLHAAGGVVVSCCQQERQLRWEQEGEGVEKGVGGGGSVFGVADEKAAG
jgi:hypothetical protein